MSRLGTKNRTPSPRALAKAEGRGRYFSKVCDKHPEYIGERLTASGHCYGCAKENVARAQAVGGSQHERARAFTKRWYGINRFEVVAKQIANRAPEKLASDKARLAKYNQENPDLAQARAAKHKASKKKAIPAWANMFYVQEAYRLAALRTKVFGISWQVDHIVPLQSIKVCGLHVENNLQVVPAKLNQAKGNRYWPQMPA